MTLRQATLVFASLLLACNSRAPLYVSAPSGVDHLALLVFTDDARLIEASGLEALGGAERVRFEVDAELKAGRVMLVGYRAAALAPLDPPSATELSAQHLRAPLPAEPALPAPEYTYAMELDGTRLEPGPVPELTAAWLPPCPSYADAEVRLDCVTKSCAPRLTANGCSVVIDAEGICGAGSFTARLGPNAQLTHGSGERYELCRSSTTPALAQSAFVCESTQGERCRVDLSPALPPQLKLRTVPLEPVHTVFSAALLGDRLLLATSDAQGTGVNTTNPKICLDAAPSRLALADVDTGAEQWFPAPPCTLRLVTDPTSGGFVAVTGFPDRRLEFYSRDVVLSSSVAIDGAVLAPEAVRSGDRLYVLVATGPVDPSDKNFSTYELRAYDLRTRRWFATVPLGYGYYCAISASPDRVMVIDDDGDTARTFDAQTLLPKGDIELRIGPAMVNARNFASSYHAGSGRFLVQVGGTYAGFTVIGGTEVLGRAVSFGESYRPLAVSSWPHDPSLVLVGLDPAGLTLFSPTDRRFLPGRVPEPALATILVASETSTTALVVLPSALIHVSPR